MGQLKELCSEKGMSGYKKLRKQELINLLVPYELYKLEKSKKPSKMSKKDINTYVNKFLSTMNKLKVQILKYLECVKEKQRKLSLEGIQLDSSDINNCKNIYSGDNYKKPYLHIVFKDFKCANVSSF